MEKRRLKEKEMVVFWSLELKEKGKEKELGFFVKWRGKEEAWPALVMRDDNE